MMVLMKQPSTSSFGILPGLPVSVNGSILSSLNQQEKEILPGQCSKGIEI